MVEKSSLFLVAGLLALPSISFAEVDCDFDKPVGSCTGSIQVLSSSGAAPNYKAEVIVKSSVSSCSSVDFYFGTSKQTSFLRDENSKKESVFGTKRIAKRSLPVRKCTTYEAFNASLTGTWSYAFDTGTTKGTVTVRFADNNGSISGTWTSKTYEQHPHGKWQRRTERRSFKGNRDGTSILLTWARGSSPAHYELKGSTIVDDTGEVWVKRQ